MGGESGQSHKKDVFVKLPSTIREEDDEDSLMDLDTNGKDKKRAFQLINNQELRNGIKKLRENKKKALDNLNKKTNGSTLTVSIIHYSSS